MTSKITSRCSPAEPLLPPSATEGHLVGEGEVLSEQKTSQQAKVRSIRVVLLPGTITPLQLVIHWIRWI